MADTKTDKPVIDTGDHDRIVALSVSKDGTPDQSQGFEIIGDKDAALEATKRQFEQIAVSAVDAEKRNELGLGSTDEGSTADAAIDALRKEHEKAEAAADKKAEAIVNQAHKG